MEIRDQETMDWYNKFLDHLEVFEGTLDVYTDKDGVMTISLPTRFKFKNTSIKTTKKTKLK